MARSGLAQWFPPSRSARSPVDDRIRLRETASRSAVRRAAEGVLRRTVGSRVGLGIVRAAMGDPHVRAELLLSISDRLARSADFDAALREPNVGTTIEGFDDLVWLFSSNWLNHRFTRLDLDEAVYLYRLLQSIEGPRVAELGRFRGGSTLFFAASAAQVTSVDGNPRQVEWEPALRRALDHFTLGGRVELVVGDTRTHEIDGEYDLVFFDASVSRDGLSDEIAHWWPAIKPGGHAIFRDGRAQLPHLTAAAAAVQEFVATNAGRRMPDTTVPGCLVHVVAKTALDVDAPARETTDAADSPARQGAQA